MFVQACLESKILTKLLNYIILLEKKIIKVVKATESGRGLKIHNSEIMTGTI